MNKYLEIGVEEFNKSWLRDMEEITSGKTIRASGRPTKAAPYGEDGTWWKQQGPAYIQSWITWRQANPNLHILTMEDGSPAIELGVLADIEVDGGEVIQLKGYIDRVFVDESTGQVLIVDLKTGKTTPNGMQLGFYRRALKAAYGIDAQYGAYWMAREGALSAIEDLDRYTDQVIDYWVAKTYAGIKAEIFLPHVTNLCKGCGVQQHCYVFNPNTLFSPFNTNMPQVTQEEAHA